MKDRRDPNDFTIHDVKSNQLQDGGTHCATLQTIKRHPYTLTHTCSQGYVQATALAPRFGDAYNL